MIKIGISLFRTLVILTLFLISSYPQARAANLQGRWQLGLRVGPSFVSQDIADQTEGDPGPIFNGNISYGLTDRLLAGLNVEWERHQIKGRPSGFNFGNESTLSIMPTLEYHAIEANMQQSVDYNPYVLAGLGININSFSESSDLDALCAPVTCKIDPRNALALKVGGGIDYFITSTLALNGELDWKLNSSTADITGIFGYTSSDNNKISVLSLLLGVRYLY